MRSLAVNFITHEKMETTLARAKELRPYVEKLVTKGMVGTLASHRLIISRLASETCAKKIVSDIAPRYKGRAGGYTRIVKLPVRKSDASERALIEFI